MSPCDEAVNYGPYESPSFQVAKPSKITAISAVIMIYIYRSKPAVLHFHTAQIQLLLL